VTVTENPDVTVVEYEVADMAELTTLVAVDVLVDVAVDVTVVLLVTVTVDVLRLKRLVNVSWRVSTTGDGTKPSSTPSGNPLRNSDDFNPWIALKIGAVSAWPW
jgi:hypothetical protein